MPGNLIDDTQLVRLLVVDDRTIQCPICPHAEDSPPIPVSDQLGKIFGMSGDTLARIHGEQQIKRICHAMRRHLASHPAEEWLLALAGAHDAAAEARDSLRAALEDSGRC